MLSFARQAYEDTDLPNDNGYQVITPYGSDSIVMVQVVLLAGKLMKTQIPISWGQGQHRPFHRLGKKQYCAWYD